MYLTTNWRKESRFFFFETKTLKLQLKLKPISGAGVCSPANDAIFAVSTHLVFPATCTT